MPDLRNCEPCQLAIQPGLASAEAQARLARDGANELPSAEDRSLFRFVQGAGAAAAVAAVFTMSYLRVGDISDSRALAFSTLLLADVALIWLNRSHSYTIFGTLSRPNRLLWILTFIVFGFLVLSTQLSILLDPLRLVRMHVDDYLSVTVAVLIMSTFFELPKLLRKISI